MFERLWNSIKSNHWAMMAACCALPIIVILALQFFGINNALFYPLALVVCVGSHLLMMHFSKGDKKCH